MLNPRGQHKVGRLTVTFVPTTDERTFRNVPSTFSPAHRSYEWRKAESLSYMIVPKKISNARIEVDVFVNARKKGKLQPRVLQRAVQEIVREKIESEWKGLKLGAVGRPTASHPPEKALVRGSIEDILGVPREQ